MPQPSQKGRSDPDDTPMKTTVYIAYHKWAPRISGDMFTPIHVGRARENAPLAGMIGDDTGDHISDRNDTWCELTALYWAWKNDHESTHIGLMHYRRVLDVGRDGGAGLVETDAAHFDVDRWVDTAQAWLGGDGQCADIVVSRAHRLGRSVEANYAQSHHKQDWDQMRAVIAADYCDMLGAFDEVAQGSLMRLGNMAIMRRDVLDRYCAMLFDVLGQVERADLDRRHYSVHQRRYLGFLAERLLSVFITHEEATRPQTRLVEADILKLDRGIVTPYFSKEDCDTADAVNLAVATDRVYLPHLAAMLRSVLDHADTSRAINVFFLYCDVAQHDLDLLGNMLRGARGNLAFHPINVGNTFTKSYRSASRAPSNATYARFLLFSLLPKLDRVLYIDADVIVQRDICALFDTDMGGAPLGAVTDHIMTRTLSGPTPTADPNVPDLAVYHRDVLGLSDGTIASYFNAGVLLFDFAAMENPSQLGAALIKDAHEGQFMFRDQDILNRAFAGQVFALDARWNVFNSDVALYARVPRNIWAEAEAARRDPWIIHFADKGYKPWNGQSVPLGDAYWSVLVRTPFFHEVLRRGQHQRGRVVRERVVKWGKALAVRLPFLKGPMVRVYYHLGGKR